MRGDVYSDTDIATSFSRDDGRSSLHREISIDSQSERNGSYAGRLCGRCFVGPDEGQLHGALRGAQLNPPLMDWNGKRARRRGGWYPSFR